MKVVFTKEDQRVIAWAWQQDEAVSLEMSEQDVARLASWIEASVERIYGSSGMSVSPQSRAMAMAARLRGLLGHERNQLIEAIDTIAGFDPDEMSWSDIGREAHAVAIAARDQYEEGK